MRLNAKILKNVYSVNAWQYANQANIAEGQSNDIYLQVVNLDQSISLNEKSQAFPESPIRIILSNTAILTATFEAIDNDEQFDVVATSPFPEDLSIFKLSLTDLQVPNSGNLKVKIVDGSKVYVFNVKSAISVTQSDVGMC